MKQLRKNFRLMGFGPLVIALTALLVPASQPAFAGPGDPRDEPPNFLILIADDLGWDDVGAYGNNFVATPHIDALARRGLRYDNAFLVTSSCSPSRGSILTGKYPHSNGLVNLHDPLPADQATLGGLLRDAGYYTASVGKWHIGAPPRKQFSKVIDDRDKGSGTSKWIEVLRKRPQRKPFFLWYASRDPHRPHDAPALDPEDSRRPEQINLPEGFVDGPGTRSELLAYYREVERFDRDIGLVMEELARQGVSENTVIIVMSDNGRPFHRGKTTLYDSGIKTPFIVHWPKAIKPGGVRSQLVSMVDLAPTVMELAGVTAPDDMQGVSMVPTLNDPDHVIRDYVFSERNRHGAEAHERAVRSLQYLYKENQYPRHGDCIENGFAYTAAFKEFHAAYLRGELPSYYDDCFATIRPPRELYRVEAGSMVPDNIIDDPGNADVARRLAQVLRQWRLETRDFDYNLPAHKPGK